MESIFETLRCRAHHSTLDSRFALKGTGASYAPDRAFDTEHIRLDLNLDLKSEHLRGRATLTLRAIVAAKEMTFDAVNFTIRGVRWNGKKASHSYKNGKLKVSAVGAIKEGARVHIEIDYDVRKPRLGLYFIKPNRQYPDRPLQAWTQGEDEYARYWFPCYDAPGDRTTTEVVVSVPAGFTAVSNGKLLGTKHNRSAKTSTFHWRQDIPHATYLVTLAVGRFSLIRDSWRGMPVTYYCEKGREAETKRAFGNTPRMLEFFSGFIGTKYPYAKYAQVAAAEFIYGGMENTSATTQTDSALLDERVAIDYTSDELVAHELAHQWFGDYLTCKDWSHAWLNESFATYFDALYKRFDRGEDEFLYAVRNNAEAYFQEDKDHYRRSIVTKVYKRPTDLFDRHLYEKGSVVLFMLHRLLGEDLFRKSIATYVRKNRGRVVETIDLIAAIEEATGRNLRRFFDQWVFGAGHPEFKIRAWWDSAKKKVQARVTQTHGQSAETGLFTINTDFLFVTKKGEKRVPVTIDRKSHLFSFDLDSEPTLIQFDPDFAVLKRTDFPKPERLWTAQLAKSKNPLGRIEAAYALARHPSPEALRALRKALFSDDFWGVQVEAARALGTINTEEAGTVLIHALQEIQHPKVRRAVYGALRAFNNKTTSVEVERRFRKEKSYFAEAEGLRLLGAFRHPKYEDILKEALERDSWNDVIRSAAVEGFAASRSREWLPLVLSYTKPGRNQKLRLAAIRSLAYFDADDVQKPLLDLTTDTFPLAQIAAVRVLQQVGDERALPKLKKIVESDVDGRLKRLSEEAIERISKGFES